jgi:hypothetical protein
MNDNISNANSVTIEPNYAESKSAPCDSEEFFLVLEILWAFGAGYICMLMFELVKFANNISATCDFADTSEKTQ